MTYKLNILFTSNVFTDKEIGSNGKISLYLRNEIKNLWNSLDKIANVKIFNGRFPSDAQIKNEVETFNPDILGCHLSHIISAEVLKNSNIIAVATSTVGYNHIQRIEEDNILITHTPGVLHETVADYTVALIMANLRNIVDLHNNVWNKKWTSDDKWDLDQSLSTTITDKILGIIGLGEIGKSVVRKLYPWGVKIFYYDLNHKKDFEKNYPLIEFKENLETIFRDSDIISIHVPLNKDTENLIGKNLLKLMKNDSLLINTARGGVLDIDSLINLLENKELQINIAFDVYPIEPIDNITLERLKKIKSEQPNIRMILLPHNASADANTRAKMNILFLKDIIKIINSSTIEDLHDVHIIPEHKTQLEEKKWRIYNYWGMK
ncbi:MAG: NAD(P)-dependent oxidoreductase [Candidatus Hermodarchaeota archaeon]